jgi:hypothetical protein
MWLSKKLPIAERVSGNNICAAHHFPEGFYEKRYKREVTGGRHAATL